MEKVAVKLKLKSRGEALADWFQDNAEKVDELPPKCKLVLHLGEADIRIIYEGELVKIKI